MLAAYFFSETRFFQSRFAIAVSLIVIVGLAGMLASSNLTHLREGSKINADEIAFAKDFKKLQPVPSRTVFLSDHGGKIAELSDQIPFDANQSWFLPNPLQIRRNEAFFELQRRSILSKKIMEENCADCIPLKETDFVMLDTSKVTFSLPFPIVLERGTLKLYDVRSAGN